MDRGVRRIKRGPIGRGVEMLIDEAIPKSRERHPLGAPLPEADPVPPAMTAKTN